MGEAGLDTTMAVRDGFVDVTEAGVDDDGVAVHRGGKALCRGEGEYRCRDAEGVLITNCIPRRVKKQAMRDDAYEVLQ